MPLRSEEREILSVLFPFVSQYASICIAIRLPICIAVLLGKSWWLWSPVRTSKILFPRIRPQIRVPEVRSCLTNYWQNLDGGLQTGGSQAPNRQRKSGRNRPWKIGLFTADWDLSKTCRGLFGAISRRRPKSLRKNSLCSSLGPYLKL